MKAQPIIESALSLNHSPPEQTPHQQRLKILRLPGHRVNVGVTLRLAVQDAVMRTQDGSVFRHSHAGEQGDHRAGDEARIHLSQLGKDVVFGGQPELGRPALQHVVLQIKQVGLRVGQDDNGHAAISAAGAVGRVARGNFPLKCRGRPSGLSRPTPTA